MSVCIVGQPGTLTGRSSRILRDGLTFMRVVAKENWKSASEWNSGLALRSIDNALWMSLIILQSSKLPGRGNEADLKVVIVTHSEQDEDLVLVHGVMLPGCRSPRGSRLLRLRVVCGAPSDQPAR